MAPCRQAAAHLRRASTAAVVPRLSQDGAENARAVLCEYGLGVELEGGEPRTAQRVHLARSRVPADLHRTDTGDVDPVPVGNGREGVVETHPFSVVEQVNLLLQA